MSNPITSGKASPLMQILVKRKMDSPSMKAANLPKLSAPIPKLEQPIPRPHRVTKTQPSTRLQRF